MNAIPTPIRAEALDPGLFKRGMRRLAAGVSLVTTLDAEGPHGFVATAVTSVSAEPRPRLLVCANRASSTHPRIGATGRFCVNLLAEEDEAIARRFGAADRSARFAALDWVPLATGAPALPQALASFDCLVETRMEAGSHTVFVGEVQDVRLWREEGAPLLYLDGAFARVAREA
ncbi:flavin reductase family protein [Methylobacterium aerolatum]|uniref:Flavin reductase n=1 Tax=Methylobacterium aerolatum TaxID=418708 RepID=A0ABU0I4W1_9HYPH|nr:flavin reductase family protein [Methylobacterium aerolatum]MDQ0449661.1 flavin reductase [Methylobacterium aerolatum]GJD36051.1 Flavin-dependent monooxygenase, reductase subunit HsaB [Methylobacterium aerolatum]